LRCKRFANYNFSKDNTYDNVTFHQNPNTLEIGSAKQNHIFLKKGVDIREYLQNIHDE